MILVTGANGLNGRELVTRLSKRGVPTRALVRKPGRRGVGFSPSRPMGDQRIASIDVGDIAEAIAIVLTRDGYEGKTYSLTGPEALTMTEVAERLSRVVGRTLRYVNVAPEEAGKARLAAGMPPFLSEGIDELFAQRRKGKESTVHATLREVFGIEPLKFEAFAQRHAAVFRGEKPPPGQ